MVRGRLPAHVHVDVRWKQGGIGRFSANVVPRVIGGGREIRGRLRVTRPSGALELAARFAPLAMRGGVLFSPGYAPPYGWEPRTVVTVHDLMYLDPALSGLMRRSYFRRIIAEQLRRCRLVLTVSEHSAAQIRDLLGKGGPEVVVVGNGVGRQFFSDRHRSTANSVPRLLFVGGDKMNKNLPVALAAVELAQRRTQLELLVVGEVAAGVRASAPAGVSFLGPVDDTQLAGWYASSTALLMPSIAEGFGLPALESLVAGTPVVYGCRAALPDVVGDLGWPVDPFDVESVANGIEAAISSPIAVPVERRRMLADTHRWESVADRVVAAVAATL